MTDDRLHFAGFDVAFHGRTVAVIVLPRPDDAPAPTVDAIVEALKRTPLTHAPRDLIGRSLETADAAGEVSIPVGQVEATAADAAAPCVIAISVDGLAAYAVPSMPVLRSEMPADPDSSPGSPESARMPDAEDGVGHGESARPAQIARPASPADSLVSAALLRRMLADAGVTDGILDAAVDGFMSGTALTRVTCVALGDPPVGAEDGWLEFRFDRDPTLVPRERDDGSVDFHATLGERFIEAGAVLVVRHPAVPERAGRTVFGDSLPAAPASDVELAPLAGEHTEVRDDTLVAVLGGRPVLSPTGRVDVVAVYEVPGDLGYGVGNIDFPGDVIVRGDVKPGFTIVAGGSVLVQGLVEGATITAAQNLSVMGVVGEHWSVFSVGGDLVAQYLHTTEAHVGGAMQVAREVVNCRLTGERLTMNSTGRLIGGTLRVATTVNVGTIGAANGTLTEVSVASREPDAVIRAHHAAHPGAVIRVGGARRDLEDEFPAVSFWDVGGTIVTLRASAAEHEARGEKHSTAGAA